jgi:hypothetical protein
VGPPGPGYDAGKGSNPDGGSNPLCLGLSEHACIGLNSAPVHLNIPAGASVDQLEQIGQGAYIVATQAACPDCHSPTPFPQDYLKGGVVIPIGPGMSVVSRNLTPDPATGLKDTVGQYIQATRNGTDTLNGNSALIVHPWQYERWMGTKDLEAIYSYLRVIPAINNTYAQDKKPSAPGITFPGFYNEGAVNRFLPPEFDMNDAAVPDPNYILRGTAIDPLNVQPPTDPTTAALFGRGSYLINAVIGCPNCHSHPDRNYMTPNAAVNTAAYLTGGTVFASGSLAPIVHVVRATSQNLIGQAHGFFQTATFSTFLADITEGVHAEDPANEAGALPPLAWPMPWTEFRNMGVDDLEAIFTYMNWLAMKGAVTGNDILQQPPARWCATTNDCQPSESCASAAGDAGVSPNECYGGPCSADSDCGTCQTCTGNVCTLPDPATSVCMQTAEQL